MTTGSAFLIIGEDFQLPRDSLPFWNAASQREYPMLMALVLMVGVPGITGNPLADLVYAIEDPRIRYSG